MPDINIVFDHIHIISEDPQSAASWYMEKLGGTMIKSFEAGGVLHVFLDFNGAKIGIRSRKPDDPAVRKPGQPWVTDNFGFEVHGDFDGFCEGLRKKGVVFKIDPMDHGSEVRIAIIEAPDGVIIELLQRKG